MNTIAVDSIPNALRRKPQWVHWKHEKRGGDYTKIPYQPNGAKASSTDPTTWSAFEDVVPYPQRVSGIGFMFAEDGPFVGVDLDHCVEGGIIADWAQEIIDALASYTEFSPSGEGIHIICRGYLPEGRRRKGNIEMYDAGRYFTMTGHHIDGTPTEVNERARAVHELHSDLFSEAQPNEPASTPETSNNLSDAELLEKIRRSKQGDKFERLWQGNTSEYPSHSEADLALINILYSWTGGDRERADALFRQSGLFREKWKRDDYRHRTISTAAEGATWFYEPRRAAVATTNGRSSDGKSQSDGTVTAKNSDAVTANPGSNGHNGGNSGGSDGSDGKSSQFEKEDGKQCDIIRNLARNDGVEMFSTPEGKVFASFQVDDHRETWPAESEVTRMHLMRLYYGHAGRTPSEQALKDATRMLKADAVFEHDVQEVHTRVGRGSDGALYVDLCGPKWRAVRITSESWEVVSNPAVRFRRSRSMMQLPEPAADGDITALRPFVNAAKTAWTLVVAWLIAAFRPEGPYPVLVLQGEQGSAKSTLARFLRSLIDPSAAMLRSVSRSTRDLMITAMNSHVLAFDNLSGLKSWLQDALCTLSTGGGFATRELHTDTNEIIFSATRPIVLTGIEDIATRDDLAERSLILELNAIAPSKRRPERDLNKDFADAAPAIMAGLFDALVVAERRIDSTTVEDAPRMADFAEWVVAAEPALPWGEGDFIATYDENREAAVLDNININPLARGICELIEGRFSNSWDGTPTELKDELDEIVPDNEQDASAYPGSASWVTRKLRRVKPMLRKAGIEVEDYRTNGKRKIRITLDSQSKENAVTAVTDGEKSPSDGAEATKDSDGKDSNAVTDAVTDGGNSDGIEAPF